MIPRDFNEVPDVLEKWMQSEVADLLYSVIQCLNNFCSDASTALTRKWRGSKENE